MSSTVIADRRLLVRFGLALVAACVVAVPVAILAVVVKNVDGPVAGLDLDIAQALNGFATAHPWFVDVQKAISSVGRPETFRLVATVAALWLLAVDRPRLALWALVTTWGGALLGVVLKEVVERARPGLPDAVAYADGYSFPSGHALGAFVGCAVLLLLWLDRGRVPRVGWVAAVTVVAAVCFSRIALGVHFLSDVIGGCLVGLGWVAATTIVFRTWRREAGWGDTHVLTAGIEPERTEPDVDPRPLPGFRAAVGEVAHWVPRLILPWAGLVAVTLGAGWLVARTHPDGGLPGWFATHRTPTLDDVTAFASLLGETSTITIVTVVSGLAARLVYRRWLEPAAIVLAVVGEVWGFLLVSSIVDRPRPDVQHLDIAPPTSSFPSGHTAATVACYGALAVLFARRTGKHPGRWLAAVGVLAVLVGLSRVYRGMHHPTDVVGGAAYGAVWLTIVAVLMLRKSPAADRLTVRKVES
ncbi:phosphatase PAP2 family protein [Cryptosporangium arvum]|uniref:phosphatase PAP2 family protein n=1 Tax=Cryptosporangium arvum TaxID=80871 RepID=UPI0006869FD5|nr:phosphatase PAP2 family protein [Cryptosporangium arvum]